MENGLTIVGIKKAVSAKTGKTFTTYYCNGLFSDYELENNETYGVTCETVGTTENYDIKVGDVVEFYYGKAIGNYQPVIGFKLIQGAPFDKKDK